MLMIVYVLISSISGVHQRLTRPLDWLYTLSIRCSGSRVNHSSVQVELLELGIFFECASIWTASISRSHSDFLDRNEPHYAVHELTFKQVWI